MHIFISYSRNNQQEASNIAKDIELLGNNAWFDKELIGGENWWEKILENIRKSDVFIFILSQEALNSIACQSEYEYANALKKPIVPLLVGANVSIDLLPPALAKIQLINYLKSDKESGLNLSKALNQIPLANESPNPLPIPPEVPLSYLGNIINKIADKNELSIEQQKSVLLIIKEKINDEDSNIDVIIFLKKLRIQTNINVKVKEEIDLLIKNHHQSVKYKSSNFKKYILILITIFGVAFSVIKISEIIYPKKYYMNETGKAILLKQQSLRDKGFYNGPIDGKINDEYLNALYNEPR